MLKKLLRSKAVLLRLAVNSEFEISWGTKNVIKNDSFWDELKELYDFLQPVVDSKLCLFPSERKVTLNF